jgi:hypothetical protein
MVTESDFQSEVANSIKSQLRNAFYFNIPDAIYNPRGRFNPEKKYDAFVTYRGCFTAMEFKLQASEHAFAFDRLRLIQRRSLIGVMRSDCNAYVVIGIRHHDVREAYFVTIRQFEIYRNVLSRKSLPLDMLRKLPAEQRLVWLGDGRWRINEGLFLYKRER